MIFFKKTTFAKPETVEAVNRHFKLSDDMDDEAHILIDCMHDMYVHGLLDGGLEVGSAVVAGAVAWAVCEDLVVPKTKELITKLKYKLKRGA